MKDQPVNRRRILAAAGTVSILSLAGCAGISGGDEEEGPDAADESAEPATGDTIAPGTTIVVDGYSSHWEGIEPAEIEGEDNPTLYLEDGAEYELEWINADNVLHDLQIWDENDNVVDNLVTDELADEGQRDSLTFTATSEMAAYACSFHAVMQIGAIEVV